MENELTIVGKIKSIRKDYKALMLDNVEWYNSFNELTNIEKGDLVDIKYKVNGKYNNIISIEKVKTQNKNKELPKETINTIIMCSKDIKLKYLDRGENIPFGVIIEDIISGLTQFNIF